jgi:hypothetical protein
MEKETDDIITKLEAPALSCIIATICALAISELHSNNSVTFAGLYWLIFLVSSGVRRQRLWDRLAGLKKGATVLPVKRRFAAMSVYLAISR